MCKTIQKASVRSMAMLGASFQGARIESSAVRSWKMMTNQSDFVQTASQDLNDLKSQRIWLMGII